MCRWDESRLTLNFKCQFLLWPAGALWWSSVLYDTASFVLVAAGGQLFLLTVCVCVHALVWSSVIPKLKQRVTIIYESIVSCCICSGLLCLCLSLPLSEGVSWIRLHDSIHVDHHADLIDFIKQDRVCFSVKPTKHRHHRI